MPHNKTMILKWLQDGPAFGISQQWKNKTGNGRFRRSLIPILQFMIFQNCEGQYDCYITNKESNRRVRWSFDRISDIFFWNQQQLKKLFLNNLALNKLRISIEDSWHHNIWDLCINLKKNIVEACKYQKLILCLQPTSRIPHLPKAKSRSTNKRNANFFWDFPFYYRNLNIRSLIQRDEPNDSVHWIHGESFEKYIPSKYSLSQVRIAFLLRLKRSSIKVCVKP